MSKRSSFIAAVATIAVLGAAAAGNVHAQAPQYPSKEKTSADTPKQYKMTKEFQEAVGKLPPEFIQQFKKMTAKHTRYSEDATARQIMMEILSDTQCVIANLMIENGEGAADCAMRASQHRWPKAHLLAYVRLEQINVESLGALPKINGMVEVGLEKVADLAIKKDFAGASAEMGNVLKGCATCHNMFRGDKGVSPHIVGE